MKKTFNKKIIFIIGPTASGKTAMGVKLAKKFNGEIVSADSRQVFHGLDLGTGKDLAEYDGVKYHLIDIKKPGEKFTLFDYLPLARRTIVDIWSRRKLPIVVGGTGLYIQGLVEGFELEKSEAPSSEFYSREQLNNLTVQQLNDLLKKIDAKTFDELKDRQNPHRLIRAIERVQEGLITTKKKPDWNILQLGIELLREKLYQRIDKRVDERFEEGMLKETENLLKSGVNPLWLFNLGLEYKIMTSFLISSGKYKLKDKKIDSEIRKKIKSSKLEIKDFGEMKQVLKNKSHQYARRQLTWFRRFPEIIWSGDYKKIAKIVSSFL